MPLKGRTTKFYYIFSNYCGIGGSGVPTNQVDAICAEHDQDYQKIIERKGYTAAYGRFNWADRKMINKLKDITPVDTREAIVKKASEFFLNKKEIIAGNEKEDLVDIAIQMSQSAKKKYTTPLRIKRSSDDISPENKQLIKKRKSFPNIPSSNNMNKKDDQFDGDGDVSMALVTRGSQPTSSAGPKNGETPVDYIPFYKSIDNPFTKTKQVVMGYQNYKGAITLNATQAVGVCYRMNSIYDIENSSFTYVADPDPTGLKQTPDATDNIPMWRTYWAEFYRYYSVVGVEWNIHLDPICTDPLAQYTVYCYFNGLQRPLRQTPGQTTNIAHKYRQFHPNVIWKHFNGPPTYDYNSGPATAGQIFAKNNLKSYGVDLHGMFKPGMVEHGVVEDESNTIWTKMGDIPKNVEEMTVLVQPGPRNEAPADEMYFRFYVELKYHVQLKDLKAQYQYMSATFGQSAISSAIAQVG
jgi:hypothetical protein